MHKVVTAIEQSIYIDVLLTVNFIIDYLLISMTARFLKKNVPVWRMIVSSVAASTSSLLIFLPLISTAINVLLNLLISGIILLIAFGKCSIRTFMRQIFLFFCVNYLFAGCMFGLWIMLKPQNMLVYNGVVYFNIPPLLLVGSIILVYIAVFFWNRILQNRVPIKLYKVKLSIVGKEKVFTGYIDTGNHLVEAFSNFPVLLCSLTSIKDILPQKVFDFIEKDDFTIMTEHDAEIIAQYQLRMVPYTSIGTRGLIPAILVTNFTIEHSNTIKTCYLAVTKLNKLNDSYNLLLNQSVFV